MKSFRLSPTTISLLAEASDLIGKSEGELVEQCIIERIFKTREMKRTKSFRLSIKVAELIEKASDKTGLSEGDIVEACVICQAEGVVNRYELEQSRLGEPEAIERLSTIAKVRPRSERFDKGTIRKYPIGDQSSDALNKDGLFSDPSALNGPSTSI